jgi:hypothetical protein
MKEKIIQFEYVKSDIHPEFSGIYALTNRGNLYFLPASYKVKTGLKWEKMIGLDEKIEPVEENNSKI